jgi:hypothetical protein
METTRQKIKKECEEIARMIPKQRNEKVGYKETPKGTVKKPACYSNCRRQDAQLWRQELTSLTKLICALSLFMAHLIPVEGSIHGNQ